MAWGLVALIVSAIAIKPRILSSLVKYKGVFPCWANLLPRENSCSFLISWAINNFWLPARQMELSIMPDNPCPAICLKFSTAKVDILCLSATWRMASPKGCSDNFSNEEATVNNCWSVTSFEV